MIDYKPQITIIFPSYNGEKFLKLNLGSIENLSNLNKIELIIVDNNSKDSSIKIIESYKKAINIKLIKQNYNSGYAKACNIGALIAEGEYIFFTNQDVIFPFDFFDKLIEVYNKYKKNKEIIISSALVFKGGEIHYFGAKNHYLGFSYTPETGQLIPERKIVKLTKKFTGGAFFIKKQQFIELGGFDSIYFMYYEDTDLSLRSLRLGIKIYSTNDPYLIHQKHSSELNDISYYLLERNRFIVLIKNINSLKKLIPFLILCEIILIGQSILIRKFKLRIRIYYELFIRIGFLKVLRKKSKQESKLLPYQKLSKTLDPILLGNLKNIKVFSKFLSLFNLISKLI